ncbi:B3 domain-containing protein Os03g0184500 [Selaginella moellendorffii]|nr:B3 domain-containing protein Os03g0184500 [Selaginella moellendorffii]|eukprot:XP_024540848.1 B3 domain-containing protein Os03g0184500 [Selaginella moellendorffii]
MKRIQPSNVLVTIYGGDGCERKKSQSCDIAKANNPFGSEVNSGNNCKQETRDRITADDYHEIIDNGNILKRSMDHPEVPLKKRAKTTVGSEKSTAKKLIKVTLSCSSRTVSSESAIAAASKFECSNPSVLLATTKSTLDPTYYLIVHKQFSEAFMPKVDTAVMLVNSRDERFPARWLAARHVVSGGWRGFARAEKIKVGDALVLEVVDESTFKIHVFE